MLLEQEITDLIPCGIDLSLRRSVRRRWRRPLNCQRACSFMQRPQPAQFIRQPDLSSIQLDVDVIGSAPER